MTGTSSPQNSTAKQRLTETELAWIAWESDVLLRSNAIRLVRGEPLDYCRRLARMSDTMTLPIVLPSRRRDAVFLKVLYAIWNIILDDEIDRDGTAAGLDASLTFLMAKPEEAAAYPPGACAVLHMMAKFLPGGKLLRSDPIGFNLWEVGHGLCYEIYLNHNRNRATKFEYLRYSVMTASLKIFLDIDCMWAKRPLDAGTYATLREAYDELTRAIKLASDVGTLWREVYDEDNMNYLRILAGQFRETNVLSAESAMGDALRYRDEVTRLARTHLMAAQCLFVNAQDIDASELLNSGASIVEAYSSGADPYFDLGATCPDLS